MRIVEPMKQSDFRTVKVSKKTHRRILRLKLLTGLKVYRLLACMVDVYEKHGPTPRVNTKESP